MGRAYVLILKWGDCQLELDKGVVAEDLDQLLGTGYLSRRDRQHLEQVDYYLCFLCT